jgi:hypothetical protein
MIFRAFGDRGKATRPPGAYQGRPLLQVLEAGADTAPKENVLEQAMAGEKDTYISRAEPDLKKAIQTLILKIRTNVNIAHLPTTVAAGLPDNLLALLWVVNACLHEDATTGDAESRSHERNHDARLLFKALGEIDLDHSGFRLRDLLSKHGAIANRVCSVCPID